MSSLAQSLFLDSEISVDQELPRAGTSLEIPWVYDSIAREFKQMATRGLVEIVQERTRDGMAGPMIESLRYRRLRIG